MIGIGGRVEGIIGVLAERRRRIQRLSGIGQAGEARRAHRIGSEAIVAAVIGRGRRRDGRQAPRDGHRLRVDGAVDPPALVVGRATDLHAHQKLVGRGHARQGLHEMPRGIGVEGDRVLKRDDARAGHGLRRVTAGARLTQRADRRLSIHLPAEIHDGAVKRGRQIGRSRTRGRAADRVIVIVPGAVIMSSLSIKRLARRAVGLRVTVNRISIQGPRDGLVDARHRLQMHRRDVVVIVVTEPAVPAVDIEFTDFVGDAARVVTRIKNRDTVSAEGDGAALKISRRDRDWRGGWRRHEWQAPDIGFAETNRALVALGIGGRRKIRRRQRDLLLPRGDADHGRGHPGVVGHIVRLHVEGRGVVIRPHPRLKRTE